MSGVLYLVATPIGNLEDMTYRAVRVLREADLIAAEDTRESAKLLSHFGIDTPMTSFHEHNQWEKASALCERLEKGENIALITDAGTPGISDPGEALVQLCEKNGIRVSPVPGACAAINALICSSINTSRFAFEGFLPKNKKTRERVLSELKNEDRTIIIYEAPHHLKRTLSLLVDALGERRMTMARELTKLHEEVIYTTISGGLEHYSEAEPRGEYVLVIEGRSPEDAQRERSQAFDGLSLPEHMDIYLNQGMDRKEAMKKVAADLGSTKREVYRRLLEEEGGEGDI